MGKQLLQQRKGRQNSRLNRSIRTHKVAPSKYPVYDGAQKRGYMKCVVTKIQHESGRAAPIAQLKSNSQIHAQRRIDHIVAVEGMHTGMCIGMGKKAKLEVGNVLPLSEITEGCIISNLEITPSDGGSIARAAGTSCSIFAHDRENNTTVIKLPSNKKKTLPNTCRAMIGQIACAGITEPPMLKAAVSFYKRQAKGKKNVRVKGMAMNPVEHPHGGGNHQHIGKPTAVARVLSAGKKAQGHVAPWATGRHKKVRKRIN